MTLREELWARFPRLRQLRGPGYIVGGAIRDLLLGREPLDVDVASPEPLAAAQSVGGRVVQLGGEEHLRAYRVVAGDRHYDFAQLLDGDLRRDLARRDFTINALAIPLEGAEELIDHHQGGVDLQRRLVRMIAASNLDDDPLRCLKAVRMAVLLDFQIDERTAAAVRDRGPSVAAVAPERVTYELELIFSAGRFRRAVHLLHELALDLPLFGGPLDASQFHGDEVSVSGAFAALVKDPAAFAERWRWSGSRLREVGTLQRLLQRHDPIDLFEAGSAVAGKLPPLLRALGIPMRSVLPDFSARPLLDGEEIAAITGLPPGPALGQSKRALLEAQLEGRVRTRDQAERFVQSLPTGSGGR